MRARLINSAAAGSMAAPPLPTHALLCTDEPVPIDERIALGYWPADLDRMVDDRGPTPRTRQWHGPYASSICTKDVGKDRQERQFL